MTPETIALTTAEAARELRVSTNTLLKWCSEGRVPFCKLGSRKLLFSRIEIERLVASGGPGKTEV